MTPSKPQIVGECALVMQCIARQVPRATLSGRVIVITAVNTVAYQQNENPNKCFISIIKEKCGNMCMHVGMLNVR